MLAEPFAKVSTDFFLHHFQFKNSFYSQYLDLNQEDRRKTFLNFMLFTTVSRLKRCAVYAYTTPNVVMRNKNSIFNEHQYHQYNKMCSHIQVNGEMINIWHKGNIGGIREEEKNFNTCAKRCRFEIVWTENQFLMCTFLTNRLSLDVSLTLTSDRSVSFSRARAHSTSICFTSVKISFHPIVHTHSCAVYMCRYMRSQAHFKLLFHSPC